MKYIDAEKLLNEINGRIARCQMDEEAGYPDTTSSAATLKSFRWFITSLQQEQEQPEVDLEAEIDKMIRSVFFDLNGIAIAGTSAYADVEDMVYIARHFYELGKNARKEEEK